MQNLIGSSSSVPVLIWFGVRAAAVALCSLCLVVQLADSADITVGGKAGWTQAAQFEDISAAVGDRLVSPAAVVTGIQSLCHATSPAVS